MDNSPIKIKSGQAPGRDLNCDKCRGVAKTHLARMGYSGDWSCPVPYCSVSLSTGSNLNRHLKNAHPDWSPPRATPNEPCLCRDSQCGMLLPDEPSLAAHSCSAHGWEWLGPPHGNSFRCADCHALFGSLEKIKVHRGRAHFYIEWTRPSEVTQCAMPMSQDLVTSRSDEQQETETKSEDEDEDYPEYFALSDEDEDYPEYLALSDDERNTSTRTPKSSRSKRSRSWVPCLACKSWHYSQKT